MLLGKMAFGILANNNIVGYDSILAKMDYLALKADKVVTSFLNSRKPYKATSSQLPPPSAEGTW